MLSQLLVLAAAPTGAGVKDWVLAIAGNIFAIIFVIRAVGFYAKREWGELALHVVAAVILVGIIYFNDNTLAILRTIWSSFAGS